jgi:DNA polymerase III epsilon subunit-like protein
MKHIMFDCETLGTAADAVIMSIGAVKFDLDSEAIDNAGFYASVSIDSNLALKRRVQEDTLLWWLKQSPEAQKVFHEPKQTLDSALKALTEWVGDGDYYVWSNGADFDLPMLALAYSQHNLDVPWEYWNSRCMRTYKNLPGMRAVKASVAGVKHNALTDAFNQARHVQAIQAALLKSQEAAHATA